MKKNFTLLIMTLISVLIYADEKDSETKLYHHGGIYKNVNAVITDSRINVRSEPGTDGEKIFQIKILIAFIFNSLY